MKSFNTWKDAHIEAVDLTRLCNRDSGIAKGREFGRTVYTVFLLPDPANRRGHELTCEVVRPTDPE